MENTDVVEFENRISELYDGKYLYISDPFMQAREKTSLLESKIELLANYKNVNKEYRTTTIEDFPFPVHAVDIPISEIKELFGNATNNAIYSQIKSVSLHLMNKKYIYQDDETKTFTVDHLYLRSIYKNRTLTILYSPIIEELINNELKDNFTHIKLGVAFKLRTNGGLQLYKILSVYAKSLSTPPSNAQQSELNSINIKYTISELRLQLGLYDVDRLEIQKEALKENPDNEKLMAFEKKPKYKRWTDLYSRVILPGVEEINRISDIYIADIEKKLGEHGKVETIIFKVQKNASYYSMNQNQKYASPDFSSKKPEEIPEEDFFDYIDYLKTNYNVNLKIKDIRQICYKIGLNTERIVNLYNESLQQEEDPIIWIFNKIENE